MKIDLKMKKLISIILFSLMLCINNVQAFDEINGNKIVLLTALERKVSNDTGEYENITRQRAENACNLIGKQLVDFSYEELIQDDISKPSRYSSTHNILDTEKLKHYKIPTRTMLQPVNPNSMETHYHRGGATVAVLTLGLVPILIPYKARIATEIICGDNNEQRFTTN